MIQWLDRILLSEPANSIRISNGTRVDRRRFISFRFSHFSRDSINEMFCENTRNGMAEYGNIEFHRNWDEVEREAFLVPWPETREKNRPDCLC